MIYRNNPNKKLDCYNKLNIIYEANCKKYFFIKIINSYSNTSRYDVRLLTDL